MYDVILIGCGIIGAATAYTLSQYTASVLILEAENDIATGTTRANSAILHAGYDPAPGTHMARLNVQGSAMAKDLCAALDVPYRQIGSLVLALRESEMHCLHKLYQQGIANGVPGMRMLDAEQLHRMERRIHPAACGALYAPTAAIVNPWEYCLALAETAVRNGVHLKRRAKVCAIQFMQDRYRVTTTAGTFESRYVVNAAGIFADQIHNMVAPPSFHIKTVRGEYYLLDKSEGDTVSHIVFQCPSDASKGILITPTCGDNLIVGPNAHDVVGEDTSNTAAGLCEIADAARRSVPNLALQNNIRNFSGVRANSDRHDFIIEEVPGAPGFIDLGGIKSPGLTAAPAIGLEAATLLERAGLSLERKQHVIHTRTRLRFRAMSPAQKTQAIAENANYGHVICRCETVTAGEILDAMHTPIPPVSIDGVKRRCGAGLGRCQGGFCASRVMEILSRELHLDPTEIPQDRDGSQILVGRTKGGVRHV